MDQVTYTPLAADNIRMLKNRLSEYPFDDGLTVVKELLQNADDAKATEVVLGLLERGWDDAANSLLKGPALLVWNNAPISRAQVENFYRPHGSSKSTDEQAVGRFGIGQQSIYHLCEAWLFVGEGGDGPQFGVLDPWARPGVPAGEADREKPDWPVLNELDKDRLTGVSRSFGEQNGRLLLWIPLRQQSHFHSKGKACISDRISGTTDVTDALRGLRRLFPLLPLLEHITRVSLRTATHPASGWRESAAVTIMGPRLRKGGEAEMEVEGSLILTPPGEAVPYFFIQRSDQNNLRLHALRELKAWPQVQIPDDETADVVSKPEKVSFTGATLVIRESAASGSLTCSWASFLPLGKAVEVSLPNGRHRWTVIAHGGFFPDTGRRQPMDFVPEGHRHREGRRPAWSQEALAGLRRGNATSPDDRFSAGDYIKVRWNLELLRELTRPTFLDALSAAVADQPWEDIEQLIHALSESPLLQGDGQTLLAAAALVLAVPFDGTGPEWHRMCDGEKTLRVPWESPGTTLWQGAISALRKELPPPTVLTFRERPRLGQAPEMASDDSVAILCKPALVGPLVAAKGALPWIRELCESAHPREHAARALLQAVGRGNHFPGKDTEARDWQALVGLVEKERRLVTRRTRGIAIIAPHMKGVVAIPTPLTPPAAVPPGGPWFWPHENAPTGEWEAALLALADRIEGNVDENLRTELVLLAAELVSAVGPAKVVGKPHVAGRKLFRVWSAAAATGESNESNYKVVSIGDVEKMGAANLLWPSKGFPRALPSAKKLLAALPTSHVPRDIWMIEDEDLSHALSTPKGGLAGWANLLATTGAHTDPGSRADLLNLMLTEDGAWPQANDEQRQVRAGLRNLLVGGVNAGDQGAKLWLKDPSLSLDWLTVEALAAKAGTPRRAVPEVLSRDLITTAWEDRLLLERFTLDVLARELGALPGEARASFLVVLTPQAREGVMAVLDSRRELWSRLPGHSVTGGGLAAAVELVRERRDLSVPRCLQGRVRVLVLAESKALRDMQEAEIPEWSHGRQVNAALDALDGNPDHAAEVAGALMDGLLGIPEPDGALKSRLKGAAWLPLRSGGLGRPSDITPLPDALLHIAHALWGNEPSPLLTEVDLALMERHQPLLSLVRQLGNTEPAQALEALLCRISGLPDPVRQRLVVLGDSEQLPVPLAIARALPVELLPLGWRLLVAAAEHIGPTADSSWENLPAGVLELVRGRVSATTASNWISALQPRVAEPLLPLLGSWMQHFGADSSNERLYLKGLQLPNQDGQWAACETLTTWEHAASQHQLNQHLASRLAAAPVEPEPTDVDRQPCRAAPSDAEVHEASESLPRFLEAWAQQNTEVGSRMDEACGVFLALCGEEHEEAAKRLLHPWRSPQAIRETYGLLKFTNNPQHPGPRLALHQVGPETLWSLKSITGETLTLPKGRVKELGFFDALWPANAGRPNSLLPRSPHWLVLREPDREQRDRSTLVGIFRQATDALFRAVTQGGHADVRAAELWAEIAQAHQIDLGVARAQIIEELPFQLKSLQVKEHENTVSQIIEDLLQAVRIAKTRRSELDHHHRYEAHFHEYPRVIKALIEAQGALATAIASTDDVRRFVLERIRARVQSVQYDLPRVPWELFQNADDAVGQLIEMEHEERRNLPPDALAFCIDTTDDGLRFMHWGRLINQTRSGTRFAHGRVRGYDQDLLNMLTFAASDKVAQPGATGRFGLGFKSCYLVSDAPRVQSGPLSLRVEGGLVPQGVACDRDLYGLVRGARYRPTAVYLPLREGIGLSNVLEEVKQHGGLAPIFARHIRQIELDGHQVRWSPDVKKLSDELEVEIGSVLVSPGEPVPKTPTMVLRLCPRGELPSVAAFRLKDGVPHPFDGAIPTIWVTAPLKLHWGLGWLLGGDFRVDTGRTQLGQTRDHVEHNLSLARQLGGAIAVLLKELDCSPVVADHLGLVSPPSKKRWLKGLWGLLRRGLSEDHFSSSHGRMVAEAARAGWIEAARANRVIPTELPGAWDILTRGQDIRFVADGTLLKELDLCTLVTGWSPVVAKFPPGSIVAPAVAAALNLGPQVKAAVGLVECVSLLIEHSAGEVESPRWKGLRAVIERLMAFEWAVQRALIAEIRKVGFPTSTGQIRTASDLVAAHRSDSLATIPETLSKGWELTRDERRLSAFAPPEHILRPAAVDSTDILAVYLEARKDGKPKEISLLARWASEAGSEGAQHGVLLYLCEGERRGELIRSLGNPARLPWAHNKPTLLSTGAYARLNGDEKRAVLIALFPSSIEDMERESASAPPPPAPGSPDLRPLSKERARRLLVQLHERWSDPTYRTAHVAHWRDQWYPRKPLPWTDDRLHGALQKHPEDDPEAQDAWMIMFTLATVQGLGRAKPHHHRGFVEALLNRKIEGTSWWSLLFGREAGSDTWFRFLEGWAGQRNGGRMQYDHWLTMLPELFPAWRWLPEYRNIVLRAGVRDTVGPGLFSPRTDPEQNFGGSDAPSLPVVRHHWLLRELLRLGVLPASDALLAAAWPRSVALERVAIILGALVPSDHRSGTHPFSEAIWAFLQEMLGPERDPAFFNCYDLPLLSDDFNRDLMQACNEEHISVASESAEGDEAWDDEGSGSLGDQPDDDEDTEGEDEDR